MPFHVFRQDIVTSYPKKRKTPPVKQLASHIISLYTEPMRKKRQSNRGWLALVVVLLIGVSTYVVFQAFQQFFRSSILGASTQAHIYDSQWGSYGTGDSQFVWSYGDFESSYSDTFDLATDSQRNVYVIDTYESSFSKIQKFDSSGNFVLQWGTEGAQQIVNAYRLAINSQDRVFVTACGEGCGVMIFSAGGDYLDSWSTSAWLEAGDSVLGMDFDSNDHLHILKIGIDMILKVVTLDAGGEVLAQHDLSGEDDGGFLVPADLVVDNQNNFYVSYLNVDITDIENPISSWKIKKFDSSGNLLAQLGGIAGTGSGEFDQLHGLAIDSDDNLYVVDANNNRIQKFDSSGSYLTQWGSAGSGDGQFELAGRITIDSANNLYVTDQDAGTSVRRIQKFSPPSSPSNPTTPTSTTSTNNNTTQNSQPSLPQLPQLSNPLFGSTFIEPLDQSGLGGRKIGAFVHAMTFTFDGFLTAFIDTAKQLMSKEVADSGNAVLVGDGDGVLTFQENGVRYWQVGKIYSLWFKAHQATEDKPSAIIIPELQQQGSIIYINYVAEDLINPSNPSQQFDPASLKLAFSADGVNWQIVPSSVVDSTNKSVSTIDKIGGYYMIVAPASSLQ